MEATQCLVNLRDHIEKYTSMWYYIYLNRVAMGPFVLL